MKVDNKEKIAQLFDLYKNFLTQTQKQILHLYLIEDLSLQEIALIQASSRQAVHDAIKKGQIKLLSISKKIQIENI